MTIWFTYQILIAGKLTTTICDFALVLVMGDKEWYIWCKIVWLSEVTSWNYWVRREVKKGKFSTKMGGWIDFTVWLLDLWRWGEEIVKKSSAHVRGSDHWVGWVSSARSHCLVLINVCVCPRVRWSKCIEFTHNIIHHTDGGLLNIQ